MQEQINLNVTIVKEKLKGEEPGLDDLKGVMVKWIDSEMPLSLFMYDYEIEREDYKTLYREEIKTENSLCKDPRFLCNDLEITRIKEGDFSKTEKSVDISEKKIKDIELRMNNDTKTKDNNSGPKQSTINKPTTKDKERSKSKEK